MDTLSLSEAVELIVLRAPNLWGSGALLLALSVPGAGCDPSDDSNEASGDATGESGETYPWRLPDGVAAPPVPADNPMTSAKVELGRHLFYDPRLSGDASIACGGCHVQDRAFADGRALSEGRTGVHTPRNSMALANVAYTPYLTWGNLTLVTLEGQALVPLFGDNPVEMLADADPEHLRRGIGQDPLYLDLMAAAYPQQTFDEQFSWPAIIDAIASFQRSLVSFDSAYDRYLDGQTDALTGEQLAGMGLFFSDRLACGHCHAGRLLSLAFPTDGQIPEKRVMFRNTGLYNLTGGPTRYPSQNVGIVEFTGAAEDEGKHRIPSLRNIELTGPYMHDGSIESLDAVIDHYAAGGRTIEDGPYAGDGSAHPNRDPLVAGFELSAVERQQLLAFLKSLTDWSFVSDPAFADPWSPVGG